MRPEFIVSWISMGSVLIPLSFVIVFRSRITQDIKLLLYILFTSLLCDLLSFILSRNSINTHWIGNIYLVAQFVLLSWMFRELFSLQGRRVVNIILVLFFLFYIINLFYGQGPKVFNSFSNVVASLILISFCFHYFYRLLHDLPIIHIHRLPMLWVCFAVMTYYAGNFFLFLVKNYLLYGDTGAHKLMWILHNLLNISKNVLFAIALWQSYRKVKLYTLSSSAP
jgi:hypothetical protein